jgi:multidrug efflux pump subunit AcrA (membrane-fusion protein)
LSPAFDGVVAEVFVRPGQAVGVGDPVLRLSTGLEEAELALVEARANATGSLNAARQRRDGLQARVDRLRQAYEQQAVSYGEFEAVELELRSAEAEVARRREELQIAAQEAEPLRRKIELATVRSPAAGVVGEDVLDPGEATQGRSLLTLYVLSPLRVEAFVPRDRLPDVLAAGSLTLQVDGDIIPASAVTFDYVSPIADLASGTISVFLHLESDQVLPGSACVAHLPSA